MKLTGIPLNEMSSSVRSLFLLMVTRPHMLFEAQKKISIALVLGILSFLLYTRVFAVMSDVKPVWAFTFGFICCGLSALVMHAILTHEDRSSKDENTEHQSWDAFAVLMTVLTLPVYFFAHAVRFRHKIRTQFPDPKQDARHALFQTLVYSVTAWNRRVPTIQRIVSLRSVIVCGTIETSSQVSDQLVVFVQHEAALRDIVQRFHTELVNHPIGTAHLFSVDAVGLEISLRDWIQTTNRLMPGMNLRHDFS